MTTEILSAGEEDLDLRLDKLLSQKFPDCSRTYFQHLIEKGSVLINGTPCKKREKLRLGDEIEICFELTPEINLLPENIPLDILFEDDDLLAINKPAGMVVHPAPGHFSGTFVNALLFHCKSLPGEESLRPGIVHRLDKDTSGVLLAAKTTFAHKALVELFSQRKVRKTYKAICLGTPPRLVIEAPIKRHPHRRQEMAVIEGGKPAITHLTILAKTQELSLLDVNLITGRTHQIRVHLKHIGTPLLGDPVYGRESANLKWKTPRQLLHAETLTFSHPRSGHEISLTAPIPQDMQPFLSLFGDS